MQSANVIDIKCPYCNGTDFKQEIVETYWRYIDGSCEVTGYEDDSTRDLDPGIIRCRSCDSDCSHLFDDVEIE
jgi:hypothetical protein